MSADDVQRGHGDGCLVAWRERRVGRPIAADDDGELERRQRAIAELVGEGWHERRIARERREQDRQRPARREAEHAVVLPRGENVGEAREGHVGAAIVARPLVPPHARLNVTQWIFALRRRRCGLVGRSRRECPVNKVEDSDAIQGLDERTQVAGERCGRLRVAASVSAVCDQYGVPVQCEDAEGASGHG